MSYNSTDYQEALHALLGLLSKEQLDYAWVNTSNPILLRMITNAIEAPTVISYNGVF